MRFAMVTTFYPPYSFGGDGTYVRSLSRALAARGHEVHVVHCADAYRLLNGGEPSSAPVDDPGVNVHRLSSRFGPLSPIITQQTGRPGLKQEALMRILSRDFDVVHFHNISLVGGLGALQLSRAPCTLYTLHEHWLVCATHVFWKDRSHACDRPQCLTCCLRSGAPPQLWRYTDMRDAALSHVDRLISPSAYTAARHTSSGVRTPITVIPHFYEMPPASASASIPDLPGAFFLYAGRLADSKGVGPLVASFASASRHNLVLAGDGPLLGPLRDQYGGRENIRFLGALPQEALSALYQRARAIIVPSLAPETFGLTVIEAAAFGTPSLVRKGAGGAVELVEKNGFGFVYQDEHDLMRKADQLACDDALAARLGALAKAAHLDRYTIDKHLTAYFACIGDVLSAKRGAG